MQKVRTTLSSCYPLDLDPDLQSAIAGLSNRKRIATAPKENVLLAEGSDTISCLCAAERLLSGFLHLHSEMGG